METLFIAFNDESDSARANHVRKQLLSSEQYLVCGYSPYTTWAKSKAGDSVNELRAAFDKEIKSAACIIIMIGEDSATNPWIRYAIERSYVLEIPLFALDISNIPDENGDICRPDLNPLERFAVLERGRKIYLSERYATYQWNEQLLEVLPNCLLEARRNTARVAAAKQQQQTVQATNYRNYESMRLADSTA